MAKLTIREWASVAEIVGTTAVIVSLLFVAYSINHNTKVLQSLNDNLLYDYDLEIMRAVSSDPSMAAILVKLDSGASLTDVERVRFVQHKLQYLNMWELAHDRNSEGLFLEDKWQGWNDTLAREIALGPRRLPPETWEAVQVQYNPEFRSIVDKAYAEADQPSASE